MMPPDRVTLIMANLAEALRTIPAIMGVSTEAPREDERAEPLTGTDLPHIWVWEEAETPETTSTGMLKCVLPISLQCVYPYLYDDPTRGLRTVGRRLKAAIQFAVSVDPGRGFDEDTQAAVAFDTLERSNAIAPLPQRGFGVVHVDLEVQYVRGFNNPYGMRPAL